MKRRALFIIIATLICGWALWSGALESSFEKIGLIDNGGFVKIEKNSGYSVLHSANSQRQITKVLDWTKSCVANLGGEKLMKEYEEQPILFGLLFIFFGVSTCGIVFIVNLIRNDSRF